MTLRDDRARFGPAHGRSPARGHRPAARITPTGTRERPARPRSPGARSDDVLRAMGRAVGRPRPRPRGHRARTALGSRSYGYQMAGNGSICALRTGDWDWAAALLDEWLAVETVFTQQAEFYVDRALVRTLRGEDATSDVEAATRLRVAAASPTRNGSRTNCGRRHGPPSSTAATTRRADSARVRSSSRPTSLRSRTRSSFVARSTPATLPVRRPRWHSWTRPAPRTSALGGPARRDGGIDALEGRGASAVAGYREALGLPPARPRVR